MDIYIDNVLFHWDLEGIKETNFTPHIKITKITTSTLNSSNEILDNGFNFYIVRQGYDIRFEFRSNYFTGYFNIYTLIKQNNVNTNGENSTVLKISKVNETYPQIFIFSQFLIDQSDIGQTLFSVKSSEIKGCKFEKSCPRIAGVLKGEGSDLRQKASSLYNEKLSFDIAEFIDRLVKYSMVKYLLCKMLYGKFNIDYLLGKYNKKFIKDLANSEFNKFLDFFENPNSEVFNYNKYFLYDC